MYIYIYKNFATTLTIYRILKNIVGNCTDWCLDEQYCHCLNTKKWKSTYLPIHFSTSLYEIHKIFIIYKSINRVRFDCIRTGHSSVVMEAFCTIIMALRRDIGSAPYCVHKYVLCVRDWANCGPYCFDDVLEEVILNYRDNVSTPHRGTRYTNHGYITVINGVLFNRCYCTIRFTPALITINIFCL